MENNEIVLSIDGKEEVYDVILNVEDIEGKNYVVYSKKGDKEGKCYASEYTSIDGKISFKSIKNNKIYDLLEEIINSIDNIEE